MNNIKPNMDGYYNPKDIETNDIHELKLIICTLRRLMDNQDQQLKVSQREVRFWLSQSNSYERLYNGLREANHDENGDLM